MNIHIILGNVGCMLAERFAKFYQNFKTMKSNNKTTEFQDIVYIMQISYDFSEATRCFCSI